MTVILQTKTKFERSGPGRIGPALAFPDNHKALLELASLRSWFSASSGYGPVKGTPTWTDRKNSFALTPDGSSSPLVAEAAIGTRPALQFAHLARRLVDLQGASLIPLLGDYTIAGVARARDDVVNNWAVWGNAGAAGAYEGLFRRTDGKFQIVRKGTTLGFTAAVVATGAPFYWVLSWEQAIKTLVLRINGAQAATFVTDLAPVNNQLIVGATQALPGNAAGGSSLTTPVGCFIGEMLAFNAPLAHADHAGDLAIVEGSFRTDYGAIF